MKRNISIILALILIGAVAVGCNKQDTDLEETTVTTISETKSTTAQATTVAPTTEKEEIKPFLKTGTWRTDNSEGGQYYFFNDDGKSGNTLNYENGMGIGFSYEKNGDEILFNMGSADAALSSKVKIIDDEHISLEWENGIVEKLTFVSTLNSEHFHFFTNEELCKLALEEYKSKNEVGGTKFLTGALNNEDGSVTIQIYENLIDHNSTAAWYQVDPITGEGKDTITGYPIDLTKGTKDIDIISLDITKMELPKNYNEVVVDDSQYSSNILLSAYVPVKDFRVVSLEYTDDNSFSIVKEVFSVSNMSAEKPLVLRAEIPETIPNLGIIYADRDGKIKGYTISESGLDGTPLLVDANLVK